MGQFLPHGILDAGSVRTALTEAARARGQTETETSATIENGITAGQKQPRALPFSTTPDRVPHVNVGLASHSGKLSATLAKLRQTDVHNAERFIRRFGHLVLWMPGIGWVVFDGRCWVPDVLNKRIKLARRTMKLIRAEAKYLGRWKERSNRFKFADLSLSKGAIDRMLQLAQPDLSVNDDKLDADPYAPGITMALAALAIGQMGVHLVFFLHITSGSDNTNNVLALAFGVLIVGIVIAGSLWIMYHLNSNMMVPSEMMDLHSQR
jgi:cytochrome o ubiquinol oxidase subunit IV